MHSYQLTHLNDVALLRALSNLVARERVNTAWLLAHLAEVDARRLYLPRGFASMYAYCLEALHLSEDAAYKRIQAARAAREFPALFAAVADGRLHLSGVCLLAPHLTRENLAELVPAATHRSKAEIERWLAGRFARPVQERIVPVGEGGQEEALPPLAPGQVDPAGNGGSAAPAAETPAEPAPSGPARAGELAPGQVACARVTLRLDLPLATQDKLRRAQALLSHAVPSGDVVRVLDRALDCLLAQLERRKFAATKAPRAREPRMPHPALAPRTVPARVKRAVWQRDQGRCAFVSAEGRRCSSRTRLEFDHVDPVALGGRPQVERMRLLCRAHNQFEAERRFGSEFMRQARERRRARGSALRLAPGQVAISKSLRRGEQAVLGGGANEQGRPST